MQKIELIIIEIIYSNDIYSNDILSNAILPYTMTNDLVIQKKKNTVLKVCEHNIVTILRRWDNKRNR